MKSKEKKERLNVFTAHKNGITMVIIAFNRGQAVSLVAKEFEKRGIEFTREDKVEHVDPEEEKKGRVIVFESKT